jgi:hypothetical protein
MASSINRGLLSIGIFLIIAVASIMLASLTIIAWELVPPLMIALCGCWLLVLAGMQSTSPEKYGRSATSLLGWGVLFIAVGGALFVVGFGLVYAFAIVLLALAGLAIFAAVRRK